MNLMMYLCKCMPALTCTVEWHWRGVQDEVDLDFDPTPEALRKIGKSHDLCVTGDVSQSIIHHASTCS